jgi:glycosyltransferase involved in cell wall biosynthesis/cytochrome c-type biogenesis protein CcmH/NrfG
MTMRISLCVVARSEPGYLRACIEAARPVVDEVVVALTEGADSSATPARAAGARVLSTTKREDLAHAFNIAVAEARGDWILAMRDDDLLDPASRPAIRRLTATNRFDGFWLQVRNYSYGPTFKWRLGDATHPLARGALGFFPGRAVHLFRRLLEYQYSNPDAPTVAKSILDHGGRIGRCAALIHRYALLRAGRTDLIALARAQRRYATANPRDASAWYGLGGVLLDLFRPGAALAAFERARALGFVPDATLLMAESLIALHRPQRAIRVLRTALKADFDNESTEFDAADAWTVMALAYEAACRADEAERSYRRALEARPESPVALNNLAILLAGRGEFARAETVLRRMGPQYRGMHTPWATLGTIRLQRGDIEGAVAALRTAVEINPQCQPARVNLALALGYMSKGRGGRAVHLEGAAPRANFGSIIRRFRRTAKDSYVVSVIPHLAGGGGRVLVDVVQALEDRRHLVLCGGTDKYVGLELSGELAAAGADVRSVGSARDVRPLIAGARPEIVILHWWPNRLFMGPIRSGSEPWILYGHTSQSLPHGHDAYVVVSNSHARFQRHVRNGLVHCIPNAVDCRRFRVPGPRRDDAVTIAMLSRLDEGKFPRRLLDYLPALADLGARLLIAGRGRRRYEIEPDLRAHALRHAVRFIGVIPFAAVPAFLGAADIGLHLNEAVEESGSIAVKEMMAAGLPVVAQPYGCMPELIVSGRNGFLADDERAIAAHLQQLIVSPELRRGMGAAGRRRAQAAYDAPRFRTSIRELVDTVTRHRSRQPDA